MTSRWHPHDGRVTRQSARVRGVHRSSFTELDALESVLARGARHLRTDVACTVDSAGQALPLHVIRLGNADSALPAVGFFGGVHGLERIGSRVVIAFLDHLVARLEWDASLHQLLSGVHLVFMPI